MKHQDIAALLPDLPRWVELRSTLLAGRGEVLGLSLRPLACAVVDPSFGAVEVVGRPPVDALGEAAALAGPNVSILATAENREWVATALPELRVERAILHVLGSEPRLPEVAPGWARHLAAEEVAALVDLPDALRQELTGVEAAGIRIAAALFDGAPVAFCYAGSETESLWDISIDTLEPWRRRGFAGRAVAFEVARFRGAGKRPVWGAVESNAASRGLAAKLGFAPTDEVWLFSVPDDPACP